MNENVTCAQLSNHLLLSVVVHVNEVRMTLANLRYDNIKLLSTVLIFVHWATLPGVILHALIIIMVIRSKVESDLTSNTTYHTFVSLRTSLFNLHQYYPSNIMKIKSNTTNNDLSWCFGLIQRPSSEENETNFYSEMRAATHRATRTTDFLPRYITTVAKTGKRISFISSDEGLW